MSYESWRESVRFTDEEIATQLERDAEVFERDGNTFMAHRYRHRAERVRIGRVCIYDVHRVFSALMKTCGIEGCGKKALYRSGNTGLCSAHRHIKDPYAMRRTIRLEACSEVIEKQTKAYDRVDRMRESYRKSKQARP